MLVEEHGLSAPKNPGPQARTLLAQDPEVGPPALHCPVLGFSGLSSRVRCCPLVGKPSYYLREAKLIKYFYLQTNKNKPTGKVGPGPGPCGGSSSSSRRRWWSAGPADPEAGWCAPPTPSQGLGFRPRLLCCTPT